MHWANFIHIYQPPTQTEEITRRVTDECYRKLVDILLRHPQARTGARRRVVAAVSRVKTRRISSE